MFLFNCKQTKPQKVESDRTKIDRGAIHNKNIRTFRFSNLFGGRTSYKFAFVLFALCQCCISVDAVDAETSLIVSDVFSENAIPDAVSTHIMGYVDDVHFQPFVFNVDSVAFFENPMYSAFSYLCVAMYLMSMLNYLWTFQFLKLVIFQLFSPWLLLVNFGNYSLILYNSLTRNELQHRFNNLSYYIYSGTFRGDLTTIGKLYFNPYFRLNWLQQIENPSPTLEGFINGTQVYINMIEGTKNYTTIFWNVVSNTFAMWYNQSRIKGHVDYIINVKQQARIFIDILSTSMFFNTSRVFLSIPISNFIKSIGFTQGVSARALTWIEHVTSLAYSLTNGDNVIRGIAIKNFLNMLGPLGSRAVDFIKNHISAFIPSIVPTSGLTDLSRVMGHLLNGSVRDVIDDPFGFQVINFVGTLIAIPVFYQAAGEDGFTGLTRKFRGFSRNIVKDAPAMILMTTALINSIIFARKLITGQDLVSPSELTEWTNNVTNAIEVANNLPKLVQTDTNVAAHMGNLISEIMKLEKEGETYLAIGTIKGTTTMTIQNHVKFLIKELIAQRRVLRNYLNSADKRVQPAVVLLVAEPGVGKTLLTEMAIQQHAKMFGFSHSALNRYMIQSGESFYSNFKGHKLYAELHDPQMVDPKIGGIDPNVGNLGHVISNEPFLPNMPEAFDKGQHTVNFQLISITANTPDFNLTPYLVEPKAFRRRMKYIVEPIVKPQFRGTLGQMSLYSEEDQKEQLRDCYDFHRWIPRAHRKIDDNSKWAWYDKVKSPSGKDVWTFTEVWEDLRDYFKNHADEQQDYLTKLLTDYEMCQHGILAIACDKEHDKNEIQDDYTSIDFSSLPAGDNKILKELGYEKDNIDYPIATYASEVFNKVIPYAKPITAIACAAALASKFSNVLEEKDDTEIAEPSASYWDNTLIDPVPPACRTTSKNSLIQSIDKNLSIVNVLYPDGTGNQSQCMHLYGPYYLVQKHLVKGSIEMRVWGSRNNRYKPHAQKVNYKELEGDLAIIKSTIDVPSGKGLLKFIFDGKLPKNQNGFARIGHDFLNPKSIGFANLESNVKGVRYPFRGHDYRITNVIFAPKYQSEVGECGSPCLVQVQSYWTIVGSLIARTSKGTFFQRIDVNEIKQTIAQFDDDVPIPTGKPIITKTQFSSFSTKASAFKPERASTSYVTSGMSVPLYDIGNTYRNSGGTLDNSCCKKKVASKLDFLNVDQFVAPIFETKKHLDGSYDNENSTQYKSAMFYKMPKSSVDPVVMQVIKKKMKDFISGMFTKHNVNPYEELSLHEAINGTEGLTPLNMKTSYGYPGLGPKTNHFEECPSNRIGELKLWQLKPNEAEDFSKIMKLSREGAFIGIPFVDTNKSEVVSPAKNEKGETRTFCNGGALGTLRCRISMGWFLENFKKIGLDLFSAWGLSPKSKEWGNMFNRLRRKHKQWNAGDFKKYDKNIDPEVLRMIYIIIREVCMEHDSNHCFDARLFDSMMWDFTHLSICMKGDVSRFSGVNASGGFPTTLVNIMLNIFYHWYADYKLTGDEDSFLENVKCVFYGDDSLFTTPENYPLNQSTMQKEMAKIGVTYTDAFKNPETLEHEDESTLTFLGRRFGRCLDKTYILSPLRGSAWIKQLCWNSPVSSEGEAKVFTNLWPDLMCEIGEIILSDHLPLDNDQKDVIENLDKICGAINITYCLELEVPTDWVTFVRDRWEKANKEADCTEITMLDGVPTCKSIEWDAVSPCDEKFTISMYNNNKLEVEANLAYVTPESDIIFEPFDWNGILQDFPIYDDVIPCSQQVADPETTKSGVRNIEEEKLVTFADQTDASGLADPPSIRFNPMMDVRIQPQNVLETPIKIVQYTWSTTDGGFSSHINLFTEFLRNERVSNFLRNYTLITGDMCVKIVTNGNNFMQALLGVGFVPLRYDWIDTDNRPNSNSSSASSNTRRDVVTQYPGPSFGINVGASETVEFTIPFCAPNPWNKIRTTNKLSLITGGEATDQVNQLVMADYGQMRMSNMAVATADITVYAWLKNVRLGAPAVVPTSKFVEWTDGIPCSKINPEAEKSKETGVISGVSSKVAAVSEMLTDVPVIGGVASTVNKVAKGVTKVAKWFGFSLPDRQEYPQPFIPVGMDNLATISGVSNSQMLALDPANGISIDPGKLGFGPSDDMAISTITRRWSLLTTANYNTGEPIGTALFGFPIHPINFHEDFVDTPKIIQPSSCSYGAYPFTYWTGSIEYMIIAICAQNQKGRLAGSVSPDSNQHNQDPSNEQYNFIYDISPDTPFCFRVNWLQNKPMLEIQHLNSLGNISITASEPYDPRFHNGTFELNVLNQLVSPDPTASVDLLMFYRAGPDLELCLPDQDVLSYGTPCVKEVASGWGDDTSYDVLEIGPGMDTQSYEHNPSMYMGERILSFRTLVKRFVYQANITTRDTTAGAQGSQQVYFTWHPNPYANSILKNGATPGWANQSPIFSSVAFGTWSNPTSLMAYLRPAYMGWCGSIRRKVNYIVSPTDAVSCPARALRGIKGKMFDLTFNPQTEFTDYFQGNATGANIPNPTSVVPTDYFGGSVTTNGGVPKIEWTTPFYTPIRYACTRAAYYSPLSTDTSMLDFIDNNTNGVEFYTTGDVLGDYYVAAGEDYQLLFYLGAPGIASGTKEAY